jgi:Regulator of ribonuclease activity B
MMTPKEERRGQRIIDRQLSMAAATLAAMREAGLTEDRELPLDFSFDAPNEQAAKALAEHLASRDCLSLSTERVSGFLSRKYVVFGKTYPTAVTAEILGQWIPWIVVQGLAHNCEFDGWGAQI